MKRKKSKIGGLRGLKAWITLLHYVSITPLSPTQLKKEKIEELFPIEDVELMKRIGSTTIPTHLSRLTKGGWLISKGRIRDGTLHVANVKKIVENAFPEFKEKEEKLELLTSIFEGTTMRMLVKTLLQAGCFGSVEKLELSQVFRSLFASILLAKWTVKSHDLSEFTEYILFRLTGGERIVRLDSELLEYIIYTLYLLSVQLPPLHLDSDFFKPESAGEFLRKLFGDYYWAYITVFAATSLAAKAVKGYLERLANYATMVSISILASKDVKIALKSRGVRTLGEIFGSKTLVAAKMLHVHGAALRDIFNLNFKLEPQNKFLPFSIYPVSIEVNVVDKDFMRWFEKELKLFSKLIDDALTFSEELRKNIPQLLLQPHSALNEIIQALKTIKGEMENWRKTLEENLTG